MGPLREAIKRTPDWMGKRSSLSVSHSTVFNESSWLAVGNNRL